MKYLLNSKSNPKTRILTRILTPVLIYLRINTLAIYKYWKQNQSGVFKINTKSQRECVNTLNTTFTGGP